MWSQGSSPVTSSMTVILFLVGSWRLEPLENLSQDLPLCLERDCSTTQHKQVHNNKSSCHNVSAWWRKQLLHSINSIEHMMTQAVAVPRSTIIKQTNLYIATPGTITKPISPTQPFTDDWCCRARHEVVITIFFSKARATPPIFMSFGTLILNLTSKILNPKKWLHEPFEISKLQGGKKYFFLEF